MAHKHTKKCLEIFKKITLLSHEELLEEHAKIDGIIYFLNDLITELTYRQKNLLEHLKIFEKEIKKRGRKK